MARRAMAAGHEVVAFDVQPERVRAVAAKGGGGATSLSGIVAALDPPRAVWLMVPAAVVEDTIGALAPLLACDDVIVDGGNSYYPDDIRRAAMLRATGIHFVDVGTSGGIWGEERGYYHMIGGEAHVVERREPIFAALAPRVDAASRAPGCTEPITSNLADRVSDSGEGRWTLHAVIDESVPAPILSNAIGERFTSRGEADFADRVLSAMRLQLGGHLER